MTKTLLCVFLALGSLAFVSATSSKPVLGSSPDVVLERFGVPEEVRASRDGMTFSYTTERDAPLRVTFHAGVAVQVTPEGQRPANVRPVPCDEVFAGQSVAAAVSILGNCREVTVGTSGAILSYEKGDLRVSGGRVIGFVKAR